MNLYWHICSHCLHSIHPLLGGLIMAEVVADFPFLTIMAAMMISVGLAANDSYSALLVVRCSSDQTRTDVNATAFQENLVAVFASLASNLSDGFATSMENKAGKMVPVYGLAVCRKYLSARECSECLMTAVNQVEAYCPQYNGGRIHKEGCFLRYGNTSFYGQGVDSGDSYNCLSTNATDPPYIFPDRVKALTAQLVMSAVANNGYAVASIGPLYGLAQCWPSLNTSSCQECLDKAQNNVIFCGLQREGRGLEAGCFMRYSNYSFFSDKQTSSLSGNFTQSSQPKTSEIVPVLLGSVGGAALIVVLCLLLGRRIRQSKSRPRTDENLGTRENFGETFFDYKVLRDSTGSFDRNNMIGKGGFGEVFKGRLPDGRDVAVKKLAGRHETNEAAEEFLTEVKLLTSVRHRNLVRLLGCCTRGHERLLVYEFMPNNSLHKHLFGEMRNSLSWGSRLKIIEGTARGLSYLHQDSNVSIIHRDIKCGNILLDDRFHPKIADFGLARFFPEGQTHVSTKVGGTIGYTAPEYAVHGLLTEKADVYSYGIVVLEIVSGRKCVDATLPASLHLLLEWAWNQYTHDRVLDIVDPTLEGQYTREQALRVITVAFLCTQGFWALRPAMSEVVLMLTNNSEIPAQPTQPAFIDVVAARSENSNVASESARTGATPSHGSISESSLIPR